MSRELFERFQPALSEEALLQNNFFELYPHDGGGSFVHRELLGSVDDLQMADFILQGGALEQFGKLPKLDYHKFARWLHIEKSCWLTRMYFIVPLAKKYRLEGNEEIAILLKELLLDFYASMPAPQGVQANVDYWREIHRRRDEDYNMRSFEEYSRDEREIDYSWYDFQPASRLIHSLHALYLLRNSPSINEEEWRQLADFCRLHGETLYIQEKHCNELKRGNHQALRATALLYAAVFSQNQDWARLGLEISRWHLKNDYFDDGSLREISPSYHCFETWICRDAAILAERLGGPFEEAELEALMKALQACRILETPNGYTVVLNDGYPVNNTAFIDSFAGLFEQLPAAESGTQLLADAQLAVWRQGDSYLLLDASPFVGRFSHYHAGKNALTLWVKGEPFLVDSACCNYDDPKFAQWYKLTEAHSSLLLNGQRDAELAGTYDWQQTPEPKLGGWENNGELGRQQISAELRSPCWPGACWQRTLQVPASQDELEINLIDRVSCGDCEAELVFVLHPQVQTQMLDEGIILSSGKVKLMMHWLCLELDCPAKPQPSLVEGMVYEDFEHRQSKRLILKFNTGGRHSIRTNFKLIE